MSLPHRHNQNQLLAGQQKIVLDHVRTERSNIGETEEYDLEGRFIRPGFILRTGHAGGRFLRIST